MQTNKRQIDTLWEGISVGNFRELLYNIQYETLLVARSPSR